MKWGMATVKKSLQLKLSCGRTGYELLLQQGHPLPSIRTLQRHMKDIKFDSGILAQVFDLLKLKVCDMIHRHHTSWIRFIILEVPILNQGGRDD